MQAGSRQRRCWTRFDAACARRWASSPDFRVLHPLTLRAYYFLCIDKFKLSRWNKRSISTVSLNASDIVPMESCARDGNDEYIFHFGAKNTTWVAGIEAKDRENLCSKFLLPPSCFGSRGVLSTLTEHSVLAHLS